MAVSNPDSNLGNHWHCAISPQTHSETHRCGFRSFSVWLVRTSLGKTDMDFVRHGRSPVFNNLVFHVFIVQKRSPAEDSECAVNRNSGYSFNSAVIPLARGDFSF